MSRRAGRGFASVRRGRGIHGVLPAVCFLLLVRAAAWASPALPDASAFAGEDQIIEQYFEIRGLRITFEILPLESYVVLKQALDLKAMGEARRGAQQRVVALAQAHRDGRADVVPDLLFLDRYGLAVNAAIWDRTRLRGWRGVGGPDLSDIEKRLMALGGPSPSKTPPDRVADSRSPAVKDMAVLTEALFFEGDSERAREQLALEEAASSAAGDGSRLEIVDVKEPAVPPPPEQAVEIRVRVANRAEFGPPAVFELGVWDYHQNNATVTRRDGLRLAPGEEQTFVLTLAAPRAEAFGGYVYLDPVNDTRPEYPTTVLNFDVAWDRSTMMDGEVLSLLRDRIPDMRYTLSDADGARWVAAPYTP